ncbi:MAG: PEP-utilizing enzyme [Solirubrobacteraceae bacterium]
MSGPDPLDSKSDAGLHWTRGNVGEAFPGVQTPLSWTVVAPAIEYGAREAAYAIGAFSAAERAVPAHCADRIVRIFRGRVAANVEYVTVVGDRLPGTSGQEVARSIFGYVPDDIDYQPTRVRYAAIAYRLPRAGLTMPRALRVFAAETNAWYLPEIDRAPDLDIRAAQKQLRGSQQRLGQALKLQSTIAFAVIQPLYHALERVIQRAGGDIGVLSGTGNVEMALVSDIWNAATGRRDLDVVIREHGFHGPDEGELSSRVWREDPTPVKNLLPRYARRDHPMVNGEDARRRAAQGELLDNLPIYHRPTAALVLRLAGTHIPTRGIAKRSYLQCFDVARAASRRLGALLLEQGRIRDIEDVFYLTFNEVIGELPLDADAMIAKRKLWRARHLAIDIPPLWKGVPEPIAHAQTANEGDTITGVGVSTGVVEGTVRVILDPSVAAVAEHEILVARTTDPSWSSIMFVSAGLVVDIGGALSHAAVVAREMGVPCVVNTRTGTTSLKTGDRVRIDGSAGIVTILERA